MKRKIVILCIALSAAFTTVSTEAKGGIGVALGNPAGVTLRFDKLVITAGYTWYDMGAMGAVDYWFLNQKIAGGGENLSWYLGGGAFIGYSAGFLGYYGLGGAGLLLGARVPVGLQWFPKFANNIELYVEAAPGIRITPIFGFSWQATIGIRFLIFK